MPGSALDLDGYRIKKRVRTPGCVATFAAVDVGEVTPFLSIAILVVLLVVGWRQLAEGLSPAAAAGALLMSLATMYGVALVLLFAGVVDF